MVKITILTPTYNRGYLLEKLYNSLVDQNDYDFDWLIIDDGSIDNTKEVIANFNKNKFRIIYEYKNNGGKHTALNYSHPYIDGEYVMVLDSDDILVKNAISIIKEYIEKYNNNPRIGCFSFERGYSENKSYASKSVNEDLIANAIDYRINKNIKGDQAEIFKTAVFKKYVFPIFCNERYVGEDYLHINAAYEYDTVYINKIIRISDYRQDGLTAAGRKMLINNPLGGMLHGSLYFSKRFKLKYRIKGMMLYIIYGFFAGKSVNNMYNSCGYKKLFIFSFLPGCLLYVFWKYKYK